MLLIACHQCLQNIEYEHPSTLVLTMVISPRISSIAIYLTIYPQHVAGAQGGYYPNPGVPVGTPQPHSTPSAPSAPPAYGNGSEYPLYPAQPANPQAIGFGKRTKLFPSLSTFTAYGCLFTHCVATNY